MPHADKLRKSDWRVAPVSITRAREIVEQFHYAKGASNTATYLHGLYPAGAPHDDDCVGVAWWIPPTKNAARATYPRDWRAVLALSRLVVHPDVPGNACSFLIGNSIRMIDRERWKCLVTYADDWQGHTGQIYRATNWEYLGKTKPEQTYTLDGVMKSRKIGGRTRTHAQMLELGCVPQGKTAKHKFRIVL